MGETILKNFLEAMCVWHKRSTLTLKQPNRFVHQQLDCNNHTVVLVPVSHWDVRNDSPLALHLLQQATLMPKGQQNELSIPEGDSCAAIGTKVPCHDVEPKSTPGSNLKLSGGGMGLVQAAELK